MFEVEIYWFDPISRKPELVQTAGPFDRAAADKRAAWTEYCGGAAKVVPATVTVVGL